MDGRQEFLNKHIEKRIPDDASQSRQLTFGPFWSMFGTTSGPVSLPTDGWNDINFKFYLGFSNDMDFFYYLISRFLKSEHQREDEDRLLFLMMSL